MLKKFFLLMMLTFLMNASFADHIHHHVPFVSHINDPNYNNVYWLGMNIDNSAIEKVRNKFEKTHPSLVLKHRADSHITVITPPEYQNILKPFLTPQMIDDIGKSAHIQRAHFKIICIGRGVAFNNDQQLQTFFLVAKSSDLIKVRQKIFNAYVKNGGEPSRFDPENFTPHITFAYTDRDLFESDGVFKQKNSCIEKWNKSTGNETR